MKKTITSVLALVLFLGVAFGASQQGVIDLVKKIMAVPAEKILSDELLGKFCDKGLETALNYGKKEPVFRTIYYTGRGIAYAQPALAIEETYGLPRWDSENAVKTIVISKIKEWLHKDNNLVTVFETQREKIALSISSLNKEQKEIALFHLQQAIFTFERMQKGTADFDSFMAVVTAEKNRGRFSPQFDILSQNLPSEEVAKLVQDGELFKDNALVVAEEAFRVRFSDPDVALFAGRRFLEGGDELRKKYIAVLNRILSDTK